MAMLNAGGLEGLVDTTPEASEAHPVGAWQHQELLTVDTVGAVAREVTARSVVKVFPRHIIDLAQVGVYPTKVVRAVRPYDEAEKSWRRVWPDRCWNPDFVGYHDPINATASALLDGAEVPVLDVDFHALIDDPAAVAQQIADFLDLDLDVAAMAAIPDAGHRHFRDTED